MSPYIPFQFKINCNLFQIHHLITLCLTRPLNLFSTILLKNPVDMDLDTTKACLQTSDRTATNHQGNADMEACKARPVKKPTTIVTMNLHIT